MCSAPATPTQVIVLRVAEIFLKGGNRRLFWRRFVGNARTLLADIEGVSLEERYMRVLVRHPAGVQDKCMRRLRRLFGLASMLPAVVVESDLQAITDAAIERARALPPGTSFKVETNRRDKQFPLTSLQVSQHVGGHVQEATQLPVDVHDPDVVIRVEISDDAFVASKVIPGPGGLPVGSSGAVSLLLSGGIDSPVAGYSVMRRGCRVHAVYFHSFPYTGDKTKEKVIELARQLAAWQQHVVLHVVHFTDVQKTLRESARGEFAVLLYRRMMVRVACLLAANERSKALVTGENLGQVASQTLENLHVIADASTLPILRPLITDDKLDIVRKAKQIGTYDTSILPYDDCCSLFVPKHPATRARVADLHRAEAGIDTSKLAQELASNAERHVVDLRVG